MEKYEEMKSILEEMSNDFAKLYEKGVKAAAPRIRKGMQEIKRLAQEVRVDVQAYKESLEGKDA